MATIKLDSVKKSFGKVEVIKGVDLDIHSQEFVVFVGPSGCGKSTLLRLIAGLEDITSGDIAIKGRSMNGVRPADRNIADGVPVLRALPAHDGVREHGVRPEAGEDRPKAEIEEQGQRGRRDPAARPSCWTASRPRSSPAASASAWPSAAPSCANRRCSCSTSRCPTSTRRCACRCASRSPSCTTRSTRP